VPIKGRLEHHDQAEDLPKKAKKVDRPASTSLSPSTDLFDYFIGATEQ